MVRESPYSDFKFLREYQYAWLTHFLWYQYTLLGDNKKSIFIEIEKGWFSDAGKWLKDKFFGGLNKRPKFPGAKINVNPDVDKENWRWNRKTLQFPEGAINRHELEDADKEVFDFLEKNWNPVYEESRQKSLVLGYAAQAAQKEGIRVDKLKKMGLSELNDALLKKDFPGLDDFSEWKKLSGLNDDKVYQLIYANQKGAEWLAIYDSLGRRQGKAYENITKMYREIIAQSIIKGDTISDLKSKFIFPDDSTLRDMPDKQFQDFVETHLNRDMHRFAVTESAINYNNGKLLRMVHGRAEGEPQYVRFVKGG